MAGFGAITIERQYASGGSEIGRLISKKLGIPSHDHEILEMAAENCGIPKEMAGYAEETTTNSLLFSLSMMKKRGGELPLSERIFNEETAIITELVKKSKCVIVGRCAGYILKNRVKCLNVYIYSEYEKRLDRATNMYGVPDDEAEAVIKKFDRKRADFYYANTGKKWNDKECYHLCLNSGKLGIEACADIICDIYKKGSI